MRPLIFGVDILILWSLLAACGPGDSTGANSDATPTFQDGLTADDILDQVRGIEEQPPKTARVRRTTVSAFGGRSKNDVTEMILVGDDLYGAHYEGDDPKSEFLYYRGKLYTRNDPGDAWVTKPQYEAFADALTSAKEEIVQSEDPKSLGSDANSSRLANESVGGKESYQLAFSIENVDFDPSAFSETLSSEFERETGEEIPTIPADYFPRSVSYEIRFWYAVSDLTFTRYQMRITATESGEEMELMRRTMEVLDRDQPLSLPGPLPEE